MRAVVLVEGPSDRAALLAVARRCGRSLDAEGVAVLSMGGATNVTRFLERYGPHGLGVRLAGLCDAREERFFRRGMERAGVGAAPTREAMTALGFFVCDADLEDELIRALGVPAVERVVAAEGEAESLRLLRQQPAQRARSPEAQLHRFFGSRGTRKERYAPLLVDALPLARIPCPLTAALAAVP